MTRRGWFLRVWCVAWAIAAGAAGAAPNVLLIIADDVDVGLIGAYNEAAPPTPTIDDLAAHGLLFTEAWSNPVCAATRATIQTGRYGWRTHVLSGPGQLAFEEVTIPAVLLADPLLDYTSAVIGKWGLGENLQYNPPALSSTHAIVSGYDFFAGRPGAGLENGLSEGYMEWVRHEARFNPSAPACSLPSRTNCVAPEPTELLTDEPNYATVVNVTDAIAWLQTVPEGAPWFLVLGFNAAHWPYDGAPAALLTDPLPPGTCPSTDPDVKLACRAELVEAMDHEIGRLFEDSVLQDPETLANTTVIFVGDNGSAEAGKWTVWQGGVNVPLIVAGYGVEGAPRVSNALVNTSDLFLTILGLAGAAPGAFPTTVNEEPWKHDSFDLGPILSWEVDEIRHFTYAEVTTDEGVAKGIRNRAGFKLMYQPDYVGEPWYFYSLATDPGELDSLVDPATGELLTPDGALQAILDDLRARLGEPDQPPNLAAANDDPDADGVATDGGPAPCTGGAFLGCDDNCPLVGNPSQGDTNSNSVGDACDAPCANGLDDDGDGLVDFPNDPVCENAASPREDAFCQDGINNDFDQLVDFDGGVSIHGACSGGTCPPGVSDTDNNGTADKDPQCPVPWDQTENVPPGGCGLGAELALLAPLLARLRRRRRPPQGRSEIAVTR